MSNFNGMRFMGTGKTQKMLEDARDAMLAGEDVLILTTSELHSRQLATRFRDLVAEVIIDWNEEQRAKMGKGRMTFPGDNLAGAGPWTKLFGDHFFVESQAQITFEQWRQVAKWFVTTVETRIRPKLEPLPPVAPHPLIDAVDNKHES